MSAKAVWIAKKRREARAAGLCITCCKRSPDTGRSVCRFCARDASRRTVQRRAALRSHAQSQQLIATHERAGDVAGEHHLYEDASSHYQIALTVGTIASKDRLRIFEKLSNVLLLGKNPSAIHPWLEQFALQHSVNATDNVSALRLLYQRLRQLEVAFKIDEALSLLALIIQIGEKLDDPYVVKMAHVRKAGFFIILSRYDEAQSHLDTVGDIGVEDDPILQARYYLAKAKVATSSGNAVEAYKDLERAVEAAEKCQDSYRMTSILDNYGLCALELGNIDLAKTCTERALLIARRHRISWRIPELCLTYAGILTRMGRYEVAHDYLLDALSYDVRAPALDEMFAEVGIPLAIHMSDEIALAKCVRPSIIQTAFQSHTPDAIGPTVAAFARFYASQGKVQAARKLLHRALAVVHHLGCSWDLTLEVALRGALSDIPLARSLLQARMLHPSHDVAAAFLLLFDAIVAQRTKRTNAIEMSAMEAMQHFEKLHWYGYANLARKLWPSGTQIAPIKEAPSKPVVDMHAVLTIREQQVAELVLKGLTNREIASRLSITKHTVDSHVASLMSRLGIRSRYQLPEVLPQEDRELSARPL